MRDWSTSLLPVSNFPGEDTVVLHTVLLDASLDLLAEAVLGPGASHHPGADAARLLVTVQDL